MAIDAEACLAPYEGHQVVEALTAGKKTLKLLHLQDHLTSSSADFFFERKTAHGAEMDPCFTRCMCYCAIWSGDRFRPRLVPLVLGTKL
jgi:hypothetical protein